jgi:hypothetical protein
MLQTIFGEPVQHPRRMVSAWVGPFADNFLGDYPNPGAAAKAARAAGYRTVHVIYRNGDADALALDA